MVLKELFPESILNVVRVKLFTKETIFRFDWIAILSWYFHFPETGRGYKVYTNII